MLNDTLSNAMVNLKNFERTGKNECLIKPASNLIKDVLQVLQENNYIEGFEHIEDGKAGKIKVQLKGKINNCNAIKPRLPVKITDIEKYEKVFLPAKDFGILILSTPYGVLSHNQAKEKKTGGVLLSFVY